VTVGIATGYILTCVTTVVSV